MGQLRERRIVGPVETYFDMWSRVFLAALRGSGNVGWACEQAGITRRAAMYARQTRAEFRQAWDDALADACDALELEARNRAMGGSDQLLMFLLKASRPSRFRERVQVDLNLVQRLATQYDLDPDELLAEIDNLLTAATIRDEMASRSAADSTGGIDDVPIEVEFEVR